MWDLVRGLMFLGMVGLRACFSGEMTGSRRKALVTSKTKPTSQIP